MPSDDFTSDDELNAGVRSAAEWHEFEDGLRRSNRVVASDKSYFAGLLDECLASIEEWVEPVTLFRARLMPPEQDEAPFGLAQVGAPPASVTSGGRLNPPGIACLYAATDIETAIAEVRPWIGARVTVGTLLSLGRIRVVDLSDLDTLLPARRRAAFAAFVMQRPVHRDDAVAYVATQHLAEHLKAHGVDGIAYGSSLRRGGLNVALFRPEVARPVATQLWQVSSVDYVSYDLTDMQEKHRHSYD